MKPFSRSGAGVSTVKSIQIESLRVLQYVSKSACRSFTPTLRATIVMASKSGLRQMTYKFIIRRTLGWAANESCVQMQTDTLRCVET